MSAAFVLAKFADSEKLIPAIDRLQHCPPVKRWDAVDGHVQLVLRVDGSASALPDDVARLSSVAQLTAYDIVNVDDRMVSPESEETKAYLFIDADPARRDAIMNTVRALPETVCCTSVKGGCDLVAMVKGETISALERTIDEKIRPMDGVLRLKHNHVIDLKQL
jgi:DNA-binding Lrp family transcriptional regulator